ncbi:RHS repeat domain-containing protein, partial [Streptosporangium sp. OZ121]|uniref:RHS repeat domain-containing protein n=1 Tax=Streptosporangium sp. OZ121 TaxID=3444183 RepID=UPI003F7ABB48
GRKDTHPYGFAPLDRVVDGDDHQVRYTYATVGRTAAAPAAGHPREFVLTGIDYVAPGAQSEYARVRFGYGAPVLCGDAASGMLPVGARLDYRLGFGRLSGTRKLVQVSTQTAKTSGAAGYDTRSVYTLSYDSATEKCTGPGGAPFRQLASVQRTVNRPVVAGQTGPAQTVLPATTFTYGKAAAYTGNEHYGDATVIDVPGVGMPESIDTNGAGTGPVPDGESIPPGRDFGSCKALFCPWPDADGVLHAFDIQVQTSRGQATGESVTRMWVDINDDGRLDVLHRPGAVDLATPAPTTGGCEIDVYVNTPSGFVKNDPSLFPRFSLRKAMADVPVPAAVGASGSGELLCSLSRSFSAASESTDPQRPCTSYPSWHGNAPVEFRSMQQVAHAFVDTDADGDPDLVSQPIAAVTCPYVSTHGVEAPPATLGQAEEQEDPAWSPEYTFHWPVNSPYRWMTSARQNAFYIYRNTGRGFEETPTRVQVPHERPSRDEVRYQWLFDASVARVAQPSLLAGLSMGVQLPSQTVRAPQALADLNGDGRADFLTANGNMYPGTADGGFEPEPLAVPGGVEDPPLPWVARDNGESGDNVYTAQVKDGLGPDVNGDGLPDMVTVTDRGPQVRFNTGFGFGGQADGGQVLFSDGTPETNKLQSFRVALGELDWQDYPTGAQRSHTTKMVDLDYDGINDVLVYVPGGPGAKLFLGGGSTWVKQASVSAWTQAMLGGHVKGFGPRTQYTDRADYRQVVTHQAADLNGDGLVDLIEDAGADGRLSVRYAKPILDLSPAHAAPARLLRTVSNGSGATTTVTYSRDSEAGKWVVKQVSTDPGHGQPAVVVDHAYVGAVRVADPYGRGVFRGFTQVHTRTGNAPGTADDASAITVYAYDKDPRGLVTTSTSVLGHIAQLTDDTAKVMRVVDATYTLSADLGRAPGMRADYPSRVVLPEETVSYTCTGAAGQTLAACRTSGAKVRQVTDWDRQEVGGKYVMDLPAKTDTIFTNGQGKQETRRTRSLYRLAWTSAVFNVAPDITGTEVALDGAAGTELGRIRYAYHDEHFRFVKTITVEDADEDVPDKTSRFVYYGGTGADRGQLYRTWAPEQAAQGSGVDSPGYTQYGYDVHGVHVVRTEGPVRYDDNPIRHVVTTVIDPGTGAVLESEGPNYGCPDGPDTGTAPDPATACSFDQADQANLTELVRTHVDGLGRPTRSLSFAIGDTARTQGAELSRTTYDDRAAELGTGTGRVSIVAEDPVGDGEVGRSVIEVDGLGRALRTSVDQDGSRTRINTFTYDAQGRAQDVFVPRADGTAGVVGFRTSYDALGRAIEVAEHGTTFTPLQRTTYDGLKTTTAQMSTGSSPAKQTTLTTDAAGQLIAVGEQLIDPIDAVTRYAYDGAGNTAKVTDPDGITTTFTHDYSGNRLSSTTAGRTWRYGYDRNDNPTSVTEPLPAGAEAADYTHHNVYDAADRLIRQVPAVRDLEASEANPADRIAEFKIGATDYVYDTPHPSLDAAGGQAGYSVGRLTSATSPALTTISR